MIRVHHLGTLAASFALSANGASAQDWGHVYDSPVPMPSPSDMIYENSKSMNDGPNARICGHVRQSDAHRTILQAYEAAGLCDEYEAGMYEAYHDAVPDYRDWSVPGFFAHYGISWWDGSTVQTSNVGEVHASVGSCGQAAQKAWRLTLQSALAANGGCTLYDPVALTRFEAAVPAEQVSASNYLMWATGRSLLPARTAREMDASFE